MNYGLRSVASPTREEAWFPPKDKLDWCFARRGIDSRAEDDTVLEMDSHTSRSHLMSLFSYVVRHDQGFAPNPYGGFLTLATCKPKIRKTARVGDYIVGTGSSTTVGHNKLIYAGRVSDVVSLEDYGRLEEFICKVPVDSKDPSAYSGDNIYSLDGRTWHQRPNRFHGPESIQRDLSGENALICRDFYYYGGNAIEIPAQHQWIIKAGPGHKRITDGDLTDSALAWLQSLPRGIHGKPAGSTHHTSRKQGSPKVAPCGH